MDYDVEERRIHWMIFICTIIGIIGIAALGLAIVNTVKANHHADEVSRRARYEACQSLENEINRATCINGWGN